MDGRSHAAQIRMALLLTHQHQCRCLKVLPPERRPDSSNPRSPLSGSSQCWTARIRALAAGFQARGQRNTVRTLRNADQSATMFDGGFHFPCATSRVSRSALAVGGRTRDAMRRFGGRSASAHQRRGRLCSADRLTVDAGVTGEPAGDRNGGAAGHTRAAWRRWAAESMVGCPRRIPRAARGLFRWRFQAGQQRWLHARSIPFQRRGYSQPAREVRRAGAGCPRLRQDERWNGGPLSRHARLADGLWRIRRRERHGTRRPSGAGVRRAAPPRALELGERRAFL